MIKVKDLSFEEETTASNGTPSEQNVNVSDVASKSIDILKLSLAKETDPMKRQNIVNSISSLAQLM